MTSFSGRTKSDRSGNVMDKETKDKFLKELMEAMYEKIYIFIGRKQADRGFVEDVVQETFLEAYKKAEILMEHPNQLGWLYVTARHKMMKLGGKRKDLSFFDDGDVIYMEDLLTEDGKYAEIDLAESIRAAVGEQEYRMLRDYYVDGYSSEEVADKYGVEHNGFRMRMTRLKKKLRKNL